MCNADSLFVILAIKYPCTVVVRVFRKLLMKILKLLAMVILITSLSIVVNIALIKLSPDVEYSLWVSAQSLILTFMAATYCVKTKINKTLGMGIDFLAC